MVATDVAQNHPFTDEIFNGSISSNALYLQFRNAETNIFYQIYGNIE